MLLVLVVTAGVQTVTNVESHVFAVNAVGAVFLSKLAPRSAHATLSIIFSSRGSVVSGVAAVVAAAIVESTFAIA